MFIKEAVCVCVCKVIHFIRMIYPFLVPEHLGRGKNSSPSRNDRFIFNTDGGEFLQAAL